MTPCANQNIPLTSPSAASAAKNTPAWPTAAGASSGTNVPGTLPSPNLPDKAAGVYETLGPFELLCQLVSALERTASTAAEAAALFAGFVRDGYSPTLDQIYSCAGRLTGKLGQLLAILDVILEAADRADDRTILTDLARNVISTARLYGVDSGLTASHNRTAKETDHDK